MKRILSTIILAAIPFVASCQNINTNLTISNEQATEIYKGLVQGENLKYFADDLLNLNSQLEEIVKADDEIISNLKEQIKTLQNIISDKNEYIKNQESIFNIEKAKLVEKNKRRFGVGPVGGLGYVTWNKNPQGFIGIGVTYNLFRF